VGFVGDDNDVLAVGEDGACPVGSPVLRHLLQGGVSVGALGELLGERGKLVDGGEINPAAGAVVQQLAQVRPVFRLVQ